MKVRHCSAGRAWCASIDLGYKNGRRHRKHYLAATRAEVANKLGEELGKLKKGLDIDPAKQTVAEFLNRWLTDSVKPTVRAKTYHSYEQLIRVHLIPGFGRIQLMEPRWTPKTGQ